MDFFEYMKIWIGQPFFRKITMEQKSKQWYKVNVDIKMLSAEMIENVKKGVKLQRLNSKKKMGMKSLNENRSHCFSISLKGYTFFFLSLLLFGLLSV
jgi:hypothetical protein